ncbi:MAG: hypothetical protein EGR48_00480 [Lachnospiraceae bacterium]|jgi:DNA repair exonuclease SbcCD ATPase subunit|nr:hypothetical protein [Lachnospiraceae bacterium]
MKAALKSLHLENFKGTKDKTYEFGKSTRVSGMNRLGKTTIATAWFWLLADKNYELVSNPNIRPDDVEECVPTVTAVLDVDGKEITIAKMQKRKVGKPDANGISKVTLTNTYEINSVPKTERDFKADLEELGLSFDNFLVCSHPDVFTGQKQADMRKVLFKMASTKTDAEIAATSEDTADVAKLLESYKFEEIEAMNNASKKKAVEQLDAIPNQIIGLEKAKVDVDVAEQELAKADLERKIAEADQKIASAGNAVENLRQEEMQLQFDMSIITQDMSRELSAKRRELENSLENYNPVVENIRKNISKTEGQISDNTKAIADADAERKKLGEQYNAEKVKVFDETYCLFDAKKWVFDESTMVCSLCGQKLPEDKIEQLKADFERRKEEAREDAMRKLRDAKNNFVAQKNSNLEEIKKKGFVQKDLIDELTKKNADLQVVIDELKEQEKVAAARKEELSKQLAEIPEEADYTQNEEYVKLNTRHNEVLAEIERLQVADDAELVASLKIEKADLRSQLEEVNKIIAQAANNIRIDEQIADMQKKQREYEQAKADAEKILHQLKEVSKRKNALLVEEINQHFGIVSWKLFDYQKNSEYKEVCVPMVDGKEFGVTTNTGREIQAKLDICNSFQKFFDMFVPIFLDGAERLNNEYLPAADTQLILLTVTEDKQLKVEDV